MARWVRWLPWMPNPEDKHPAQLRPSELVPGVYVLKREPRDSEVRYYEPGGAEYLLEYFECEAILQRVLRLEESESNTVLDRLWNFCTVYFDPSEPGIIVCQEDIALRKWPELRPEINPKVESSRV